MITVSTINQLLNQAKFRESFRVAPKGKTFQNLSTVIVLPTRGVTEDQQTHVCVKCKTPYTYTAATMHGLSPLFVEAWKRLIKPMNVPVVEMMVQGMEVGAAYCVALENILAHPLLTQFKYLLTVEDDNIIPFIPNTQGPLMMLYESMAKGFDAVGGLYWTKGTPSMPLLYGHPHDTREAAAGMFKVRFPAKQQRPRAGRLNTTGADWHEGELVECNGMGMGFTLFKLALFKDPRIPKPWFETIADHAADGVRQYTQDLSFFEKFRKVGYRCAVDTRVKLGHLDVKTGIIY